MVDTMRPGDTAVVKGKSAKGTQTTDTYSLKGLARRSTASPRNASKDRQ